MTPTNTIPSGFLETNPLPVHSQHPDSVFPTYSTSKRLTPELFPTPGVLAELRLQLLDLLVAPLRLPNRFDSTSGPIRRNNGKSTPFFGVASVVFCRLRLIFRAVFWGFWPWQKPKNCEAFLRPASESLGPRTHKLFDSRPVFWRWVKTHIPGEHRRRQMDVPPQNGIAIAYSPWPTVNCCE